MKELRAMAEQVPVRREPDVPAARDTWREPSFGDIDTVFDRMVRGVFGSSITASPWSAGNVAAVDIEETDDAYIVEIELPGVRREDISVEAGRDELHVSGQIVERERTGIVRHRTRRSGHFSYRVALPSGIDTAGITASYRDGVLTVTIPRGAVSDLRNIPIV
jgi:HSP20 family protein